MKLTTYHWSKVTTSWDDRENRKPVVIENAFVHLKDKMLSVRSKDDRGTMVMGGASCVELSPFRAEFLAIAADKDSMLYPVKVICEF